MEGHLISIWWLQQLGEDYEEVKKKAEVLNGDIRSPEIKLGN